MIRWYPRSIERVTIAPKRPIFMTMTEQETDQFFRDTRADIKQEQW